VICYAANCHIASCVVAKCCCSELSQWQVVTVVIVAEVSSDTVTWYVVICYNTSCVVANCDVASLSCNEFAESVIKQNKVVFSTNGLIWLLMKTIVFIRNSKCTLQSLLQIWATRVRTKTLFYLLRKQKLIRKIWWLSLKHISFLGNFYCENFSQNVFVKTSIWQKMVEIYRYFPVVKVKS
jgi:hypothetical protein